MILAGDIGGTKTVVGLFEKTVKGLCHLHEATFVSKNYQSLEEILAEFLAGEAALRLTAACFGVAGPVIDGRSKTTNLPWELDEKTLSKTSGAPRFKLLNDLEAAAYGMLHLKADEFCVLNRGVEPHRHGNIAVIAAGTGLGEALLIWDGADHHPVASEGGHSDFAPRDAREIGLFSYLRDKHDSHVSYERVLSGPGIHNIYNYLRQSSGKPEPQWLQEKLRSGDPSAVISECGLDGGDAICVQTLELFASIYGAEAGNLALKCLAVGGVLVGGGIAPKLLPALEKGDFMKGFAAKGRYAGLMASMPVRVALNPRAPIIGAAHYALRL
ncbi:MAG: glucokinase [Acidiferrobacterales bacterium]